MRSVARDCYLLTISQSLCPYSMPLFYLNAMTYDYKEKKTVAVLAANLEPGVALNVVGHLAISLGAYAEKDLMGRSKLVDASGVSHVGISKYPVIITKVKAGRVRQLIHEAKQHPNDILIIDYPEQMLTTGHDDELAEAISTTKEEEINYFGAILYGKSELINTLTGKFSLWR